MTTELKKLNFRDVGGLPTADVDAELLERYREAMVVPV
jgi:hypothetical protein